MGKKDWGGKRTGAGRKPRSFALKIDDIILFQSENDDQRTPPKMMTVAEIDRRQIVLHSDDFKIYITR